MAEGTTTPPRKRGRPRRSEQAVADSRQMGNKEVDIHSISGKLGTQIGAKLHQARTLRRLTQQDLAQETFSKSYISAIEHGKIKPSLRALVYLAERLELPIAYFLDSANRDGSATAAVKATLSADLKLDEAEHQASAQPQAALAVLQELIAQRLSPSQQLRRYLLLAGINITMEDGLAAQAANQEAAELVGRLDDRQAGYKLRQMEAEVELLVGRPQIAVTRYEALVPAASSGEIKEPALRLSIYMGLGNAHRKLGHSKEATAAYAAALALTEEADNVDHLAATFWKLSVAWQQAGELERAREYASRSLALSEAAYDICQIITINVKLAEVAQQAGHWDEAQTHLEAALVVAEQLRDDHRCAEALHGLARLVFKRDKMSDELLKQAEDYANRCFAHAGKAADDALLGKALAVVGLVQESKGDSVASDKSYQQAIARLKQAQANAALSETYFEYAQLLRKRGEVRRASEYLEQAYLLGQG